LNQLTAVMRHVYAATSARLCVAGCLMLASLAIPTAHGMALGPPQVFTGNGASLVAEVGVANVLEKATWSLQAHSFCRASYVNAGLGYVPLLDATEVKLRHRVDGSRSLFVTLPQPLPAQADDVLLSVSWDNNSQSHSYRLFNGTKLYSSSYQRHKLDADCSRGVNQTSCANHHRSIGACGSYRDQTSRQLGTSLVGTTCRCLPRLL
tara:strand:+ start:22 stop:642 length:621 start_codon:yes stop_codon:yes gene_type:complete